MPKLKVLIVGASIAGTTAAYWFAKAGASITVIERFPSFRTGGQSIDIRTVGVTVMRRTPGMEAAVRSKTTRLEGMSFVNSSGESYGIMKASGDPDQQSLISEYEIFRGDLAQILFDLTKDNKNVKYVFGEQVVSMVQKGDEPISVEFASGLETADYDLVVACDGATSRTRAIGMNCGVRDHIIPVNSWAAYFSIKEDLLKGSKIGHAFSAVGGRWMAVGPDPTGVSRVILMGISPRNDHDATLPFREAAKKGDDGLKSYIAQKFEGAGWRTDEIIKGMMDSDDFYASEIVQVKVPKLYKGRFVLVGDAGYAPGPTGTGTSLAIAGAYLLAGEILTHKDNLTAGLEAYSSFMTPLITDMQKIPPGIPGILSPQTAWRIWLRNMVFAGVCWGMGTFGGLFGRVSGLWAGAFGKDKYEIPEYEWVA